MGTTVTTTTTMMIISFTTFISLSPLGGSGAAKFEDIPRGDQAVLPPLSSQAEG